MKLRQCKLLARPTLAPHQTCARPRLPHHYRERAVSEDWLFHGKDEVGREGWFVRIEVTGMYPRRYGPFATQAEACELLEDFLHDLVEPFGNLERDLDRPEQTCVIEGVPRLEVTPGEL